MKQAKKYLIIFCCVTHLCFLFFTQHAQAQAVHPIYADETLLGVRSGSAGNELTIQNSTRTVLGALVNTGSGNTHFKLVIDSVAAVNDSTTRYFFTDGTHTDITIHASGGVTVESDPVWNSEKINYYNKTESDARYLQSIDWTQGYSTYDPRYLSASTSIHDTSQIDVFLIAGQSNAQGHGDSSLSPKPKAGTAYQYYNGSISPAIDPIGNAATGSAWPSFAIDYYNKTGRKILFVPAAFGSTSQTAAADGGFGNWDVGGTLFYNSINLVHAALDSATNRGYNPVIKGVLWCQGEADAAAIDAGTITLSDYENALTAMISRYRDSLEATLPFYIFRTGTISTGIYQSVRNGQEYVDSADDLAYIVFRNSVDFIDRGMETSGNVHYLQSGYNEMGATGAENVLNAKRVEAQKIQSYKTGFGNITEPKFPVDVQDKIGINGTQVLNLPNQTTFTGTIFLGDGGSSLSSSATGDGSNNTFAGIGSGKSNTTASSNSAVGYKTLFFNTTGSSNVAIGSLAMLNNTTGNQNTAIGSPAIGGNTTGISNVAIGNTALQNNRTGNQNTAVGRQSLTGVFGSSDVTANTAVGFQSGNAVLTGANNNSFFGYKSGLAVTTGNSNVLLGFQSGSNITTGSQNVIIGYNLSAQSATANSQLSIANAIFGTGNSGTGTTVSSGNIGFFVTSPTARVGFPASSTSAASMRINAGTAPTSPNDGDIWNDATTHHVYIRLNGVTYQLDQQSGASAANPTATIGLTATNGTATTFMRSDAAPALNQAISPTWTGGHLFNGNVDLHSNVFLTGLGAGNSSTDSVLTINGNKVYKIPMITGGGTTLTGTQGDIIYFSATNTVANLAKNTTAQRILTNGGTSNNPLWDQVDLTTGVKNTLPVANGGTGQSSYTNGQLLIGNTTGNTLNKTTLTPGSGIQITNGAGTITISSTASAVQTLTDASTTTWNCSSGYNAVLTATSAVGNSRTLSITNAATGSYGTLRFVQDGTGSRTITLPSNSKVAGDWGSGTTIFTSTAASASDLLTFYYDGSTYWWNLGKNYQ